MRITQLTKYNQAVLSQLCIRYSDQFVMRGQAYMMN